MNVVGLPQQETEIVYPESDGKPMADNTKQFRWIVTIEGGLEVQFQNDPNVFVAGDLLWYPVEGHPEICAAPDAMVVFGRPKGDRGSYLQWRENNIPPQVVFEVLSANNTGREMTRKFSFYQKHGVEEYYLYDPDTNTLDGFVRERDRLSEIAQMNDWTSPRLGILFSLSAGELQIFGRDGRRFLSYQEVAEKAERLGRERAQAEREAAEARQRAERLAARLREAGIDPDA